VPFAHTYRRSAGILSDVGVLADVYARVSPRLAHRRGSTRATRAHAWLLRRSGGRIGGRFLGAPVMVVRTAGRRSGEPRESPVFYVRHADGWAAMAANAASERMPAWWLNLQEDPAGELLVDGGRHRVLARRATPEEEAELVPRLASDYSGVEHYRRIATRELPVVVFERR
jgi:deazaflavin-dependent oxidoreductase (nitroreductase family)